MSGLSGQLAGERAMKLSSSRVTANDSTRVTHWRSKTGTCTLMGVNATGALGVERRRCENRGAVRGEGVGSREGLCPFPENL